MWYVRLSGLGRAWRQGNQLKKAKKYKYGITTACIALAMERKKSQEKYLVEAQAYLILLRSLLLRFISVAIFTN